MAVPLTRLENNIWGYHPEVDESDITLKEIQIITPQSDEPRFGFVIAQAVAQILMTKNIKHKSELEDDFSIELTNTLPNAMGRWSVSLVRHDSWLDQIMDAIPAAKRIRDRKIAELAVSQENKIVSFFSSKQCLLFAGTTEQGTFPDKPIPQNTKSLFDMAPFSDPFTRLSAAVLQTLDPRFVSERKIYTFFRFVLSADGQALHIKEIPLRDPTDQEIEENIRTITWYRNYIIEEFGEKRLQFVDAVYGFSLADMIEKGLPLAPDHVFKINIGMNKIGLTDVKELFNNLVTSTKSDPSQDPSTIFPRYQLRKFSEALNIEGAPTMAQIASLATSLVEYTDVQDLPHGLFNYVANFVLFSQEEREYAYTGRKIYLWAISGTVTLGDPNIFNPSSDLFDVLQTFPQFEKTDDWENYSELLTHIIVKKGLYEPLDATNWKVGLMIAGPKDEEGGSRWFYIESFCDDNAGNVNYLLLPACKDYTLANGDKLPMIKAYRSTSSARNAINAMSSVVADLNPYGSPGTLNPQSSFLYEKPYFDDRTIPLWVGYLIAATAVRDENEQKAKAYLKRAIAEYHLCLHSPGATPPHKLLAVQQHYAITHLSHDFDYHNSWTYLNNEAKEHKELPQFKCSQPLFFIGHSLGAGLSQFFTYFYTSRRHRIPLPGQDVFCYESRGPGIDNYQDEDFMKFGRTHKDLFETLHLGWLTRHDFEYGDFTPQAGESHLGTTGYDKTQDSWLEERITVFKPLETAEDKGITGFPTRARRTGMALQDRDFEMRRISVTDLEEFDHSCLLPTNIRDMFGFLLLQSSKVTEAVRQIFSILTRPLVIVALWAYNFFNPPPGPRDENGVLFLRYSPIVTAT